LNAHDEHVMEKYRDGGDKQRQTNTQANPKANQKAAAQKEIVATLVHGMMLPQQHAHRLARMKCLDASRQHRVTVTAGIRSDIA